MLKTDKSRAISLLRDVVKQDSDHIDAYLQLGNILRDEEPQRALKIHQMLTVRPNLNKTTKVDIYKSLAMDYEVIGDLIKARKEAEQILIIDKQNEWGITFLLNIGEKIEDWDYAADKAKQLKKIIFDKTGTLTSGIFNITKIDTSISNLSEESVLSFVASIEIKSNHPVAALRRHP